MSFLTKLLIFFLYFTFNVNAEILENIEITGNKRISKETIMVLGDISPNKDFSKYKKIIPKNLEQINDLRKLVSLKMNQKVI